MNGTFVVKSETSNVQYEYKDVAIIVQGNYSKDATSGQLISINGSCYRVAQDGGVGDFFGNFNGYTREGGDIRYSMSEMSRQDANLVWDAIDEIEPIVTGADSE